MSRCALARGLGDGKRASNDMLENCYRINAFDLSEDFFDTANAQVMPSISRLIVLVKVLYFFARALEPHLFVVRYE